MLDSLIEALGQHPEVDYGEAMLDRWSGLMEDLADKWKTVMCSPSLSDREIERQMRELHRRSSQLACVDMPAVVEQHRRAEQLRLKREAVAAAPASSKLRRCGKDGMLYPASLSPRCPNCGSTDQQEEIMA